MARMKPGPHRRGDLQPPASSYLTLFSSELPDEIRSILHQLRSGRMRLEFEHRGLKALGASLDRVSNRISFAIVLAALIVGSSLIVLSDIPPRWHSTFL